MPLFACSTENSGESLTIFAAASCADWVEFLPQETPLRLQFGPSSGLARQIADGAPAEIYITAHRRWIDYLQEQGKLAGPPIAFAGNSLVCVCLNSTQFGDLPPHSLESLGQILRSNDRIAIADESVPAGDYARQALTNAGHIEALRPYFVGQDDARSTLRAVSQGQARFGFIYASDARFDGLRLLFTLDPASHEAIRYWACAIGASSPSTEAAAFLESLRSPRVQALLKRYGFTPENQTEHAPGHQ